MKTLLIMRHAKSSWKHDDLPDDQRPLNKRGKRDAPRMGQLLREVGLVPQVIITSTAERARLTAAAVAEASGFDGEVRPEAGLYNADVEACLAVVRGLADQFQTAMIVGHNPGLEEVVADLTGEDEHLTAGAIARLELPIEHWADLSDHTEARLEALWRPREQG